MLIDRFNRRIEYVRLSVTDRCDLRCAYCIPKGFRGFEEPGHWLTFDEIERVIGAFAALGVSRVRLTGGEPLLRHDLAVLAARLSALPGLDDLSLSTNGTQLQKHATSLRRAGVSRINVSLDSLRPDRFAEITHGGRLDKVLAGLDAARDAGMRPIKINTVVLKDVNDDELEDLIEFCLAKDFTLPLIEPMPMGQTGREATGGHVDLSEVRKRISARYRLIDATERGGGPARYAQVQGTSLKIGFITPDLTALLCDLQSRSFGGRRHALPVSRAGEPGRTQTTAASGYFRCRTAGRARPGDRAKTGTSRISRGTREDRAVYVRNRGVIISAHRLEEPVL